MEQIRLRQPKMPAAQSFIQNLGTFLALFLNFEAANFSYQKKNSLSRKEPKPLQIKGLELKISN